MIIKTMLFKKCLSLQIVAMATIEVFFSFARSLAQDLIFADIVVVVVLCISCLQPFCAGAVRLSLSKPHTHPVWKTSPAYKTINCTQKDASSGKRERYGDLVPVRPDISSIFCRFQL